MTLGPATKLREEPFNPRYGHEWTDQERDNRKRQLRDARNIVDKLGKQVRRINLHAPQFSDTASEVFEPLRSAVENLSGLDLRNCGRKYQPLFILAHVRVSPLSNYW